MHHPALPEDLLCANTFGNFFGVPQQVFDAVWNRLAEPHGESVVYVSMEIGADPDAAFREWVVNVTAKRG